MKMKFKEYSVVMSKLFILEIIKPHRRNLRLTDPKNIKVSKILILATV